MHQRAVAREKLLQAEVDRLKAQLRLREQQLFGRKTETQTASPETIPASNPTPIPKKRRGQQPGRPGPSRRDHSHLPAVVEERHLPPEQQQCSCCGQPFEPFPGTEDSEVLEIDVRAYRRVIRRYRYRPRCTCQTHPGIITAP